MLIGKFKDLEAVVIADMYCMEDKRYLIVSYKEYCELKLNGLEEIPDSGPFNWEQLIVDEPN